MKGVLDLTIYLVLFNSIISYFCPKVQFKYQCTTLLCLGACKDYFGMDGFNMHHLSDGLRTLTPYQLAFCMMVYLHIKYGRGFIEISSIFV